MWGRTLVRPHHSHALSRYGTYRVALGDYFLGAFGQCTGLRQQVSLRIRSQLPTSGVPKLTNRPSAIAKWITHLEQILISRQQQPRPGGDDREQITRARQAAEALFRSKPPVSGPSVPASAPADQSARKPRVLQIISPAVPVRHEGCETPAAPEPQTMRKIPRSQFVPPRI